MKDVVILCAIIVVLFSLIFGGIQCSNYYHATKFTEITGLEMKCTLGNECYVKDKTGEWTTEDAWRYHTKYGRN